MLTRDILGKINRDFETPDEAALALSVLADFVHQNQELSNDRILRCIVFVAKGDLDMLDKAIDLAKTDYRDLILWAEYDENNERVRDLSTPFSR
jgi:hypothetical protein